MDIGVGKDFLSRIPFVQELRSTVDKGYFMKLNSFSTAKETISWMKRKPTEWGRHLCQLCIWPEYIRTPKTKSKNKTNNPVKNGLRIWTEISQKKKNSTLEIHMENLQKAENKSTMYPWYDISCDMPKHFKAQKIISELWTLDIKLSPIVPWLYPLGIREHVILVVSLGLQNFWIGR